MNDRPATTETSPAPVRTPREVEALRGPFAAVMDTNVGLDLYSRHDLAREIAIFKEHRDGAPAKAEKAADRIRYRMKRTGYAWWLAMALDTRG